MGNHVPSSYPHRYFTGWFVTERRNKTFGMFDNHTWYCFAQLMSAGAYPKISCLFPQKRLKDPRQPRHVLCCSAKMSSFLWNLIFLLGAFSHLQYSFWNIICLNIKPCLLEDVPVSQFYQHQYVTIPRIWTKPNPKLFFDTKFFRYQSDTFFIPNLFDTESDTFSDNKIFLMPKPKLSQKWKSFETKKFWKRNVTQNTQNLNETESKTYSDTESDTFTDTKVLRYQIR